MNRGAQRSEGEPVVAAGAAEGTAAAPGLLQAQREDVRRRPVMFINELADLLETSTRTIRRQLRAGTFFIPETGKVDHRHRWSRERVYTAIAEITSASHRRSVATSAGKRKSKLVAVNGVGR
jgi:hypothetical protein